MHAIKSVLIGLVLAQATAILVPKLNGQDTLGSLGIKAKLSEQTTLLDNGQLGLRYFPDGAISAIEPTGTNKVRILVPVGVRTLLIEGQALDQLSQAKEVLVPGKAGEFDNGYAGISSFHKHADGTLYGFYHAEDQEGLPSVGGGVPGFYCRIGMAVSEDDGESWRKLGAVITSAKPKEWTAFVGQPDRGAGEVSVATSRDGKHLLAYYTEHSRIDGRGVQICMARSGIQNGPPNEWWKYRNGQFDQPGIGGLDSPVVSGSEFGNADAIFPQVSFSKYLDRYVMAFNINAWKELAGGASLKNSGIYVAYSMDGIVWTMPTMVIKDYSVCAVGKSVCWHPTILWSNEENREGWLVYSYSPKWGHTEQGGVPHFMVGRKISFEKPGG